MLSETARMQVITWRRSKVTAAFGAMSCLFALGVLLKMSPPDAVRRARPADFDDEIENEKGNPLNVDTAQTPKPNAAKSVIREMTVGDRLQRLNACKRIREFDCMKIMQGASPEQAALAKAWQIPDDWIITAKMATDGAPKSCPELLDRLGLVLQPVTENEASNSISYVMMIHTNFNSFARVLRQVYRPQNAFAVHIDSKSKTEFVAGVNALAGCLPNMKMVEERQDIQWGSPTILIALLRSLRVLVSMATEYPWSYVQFLTETDGPLRTNAEMIEVFDIFGGANDVELNHDEFNRFMTVTLFDKYATYVEFVRTKKTILPGNMRPYKGRSAATLSRAFVDFIFSNEIAKSFYDWTLDTWISAEKYWSTLNHNLHVNAPGGYPGVCVDYYKFPYDSEEFYIKPYISRWQTWENNSNFDGMDKCYGEWVRGSCAIGIDDLPIIAKQPHLVAHKFEADVQPAAAYCLDEWLCKRTFGDPDLYPTWALNRTFYENLPAVKFHKMKDKSKYVCEL